MIKDHFANSYYYFIIFILLPGDLRTGLNALLWFSHKFYSDIVSCLFYLDIVSCLFYLDIVPSRAALGGCQEAERFLHRRSDPQVQDGSGPRILPHQDRL